MAPTKLVPASGLHECKNGEFKQKGPEPETEPCRGGETSAYTDMQKRNAEHLADSYENRGVSEKEAKSRAWATVNEESGGGEKSGSGRGKPESHASSHKCGKKGGAASSSRSAEGRPASAKKAAATHQRNAAAKAASH
jgi:plasmid stabilization system protein ParE